MNLLNYMEEAVKRTLEEVLSQPAYEGMPFTEKERLDVCALALNHLPPRYVVTEKGHLFTRVEELKHQFKTDIIVELTKAIRQIKENPR